MPTVTFNRKDVELLTGITNEEVLKDRISMFGTDLEHITDSEICIEFFPNRPDCLSLYNFSRSLRNFVAEKPVKTKFNVEEGNHKVIVDTSVEQVRPFTACAVAHITVTQKLLDELIQMQEKLHISYGRRRKKVAIGIYPMNKIEFPVEYKALPPQEIIFRPLGMEDEHSAQRILELHEKGKEFAHILENKKVYPLFIDSKETILSMPPIINSEYAGKVVEGTKSLFIECSGTDKMAVNKCLNMIVSSVYEAGAKIETVTVSYPSKDEITPNLSRKRVDFDPKQIQGMLGVHLDTEKINQLCAKMDLEFCQDHVLVPAYRTDFLEGRDVLEDICIAYGYEHITPVNPKLSTVSKLLPVTKMGDRLREFMLGFSFFETTSYHLVANKMLEFWNDDSFVKIIDSLGDYNSVRNTLAVCLMNTLKHNRQYPYPQKLYEIGTITHKQGLRDRKKICFVIAGDGSTYSSLKQVVDTLNHEFKFNLSYQEADIKQGIKGRCVQVLLKNIVIGDIYEVHPRAIKEYGLEVPVTICELDLQSLAEIMYQD